MIDHLHLPVPYEIWPDRTGQPRAIPLRAYDRASPTPEPFLAPCCGTRIDSGPATDWMRRVGWVQWILCPCMQEAADLAEWADQLHREEQERQAARRAHAQADEARRRSRQARLDGWFSWGPRAQRQTWDAFTPHTPRQAAVRDRLQVWADGNLAERGWYLMGPVGTGKTHLAHAVANRLRDRTIPVLAVSVPYFLARLRATYDTRAQDAGAAMEAELATVPLLILDDLGTERPTDWALERLFLAIDQRYEACLPMGVTTNWKPKDLEEVIGGRLVSRLMEMCEPWTLDGADHRLTAAKTMRGRSA